jgi:hypothetical protein
MNGNANFKTLGLQADASWDEVKSAFRRLARTYHPDVAGPEGARKFAEITEAYMTLKESISPGACPAASNRSHSSEREGTVTNVEERESLFRALWRRLFSLSFFRRKEREATAESAYEYDIPPARLRFIGGILSRAESDIRALMSRRAEFKSKSAAEAILRRIASRHPAVALLALKRVSATDVNDELGGAIVEHFRKNAPASEVLDRLLSLYTGSPRALDLAKALSAHSARFSESDALLILRWYKRRKTPKECYAALLSHGSDKVISAALGAWPADFSAADVPETAALLRREEEAILVPLLRVLKREKLQISVMNAVSKISDSHTSPVVRVWASAIVRERNLS